MSWKVGDTRSLTRTFTQADIDAFAALTGDDQPIHTDATFAAGTKFGTTLVHGMLTASIFSTLLGKHIPGEGMIITEASELQWLRPVRPGDTITFSGTIRIFTENTGYIALALSATNQHGESVCVMSMEGRYRPLKK